MRYHFLLRVEDKEEGGGGKGRERREGEGGEEEGKKRGEGGEVG